MYLSEAIDAIRDRLLAHKVSRKGNLWAIIMDGGFDGHQVDVGRDGDGNGSKYKAAELFVEELRQDLQMKILDQVTKLAWQEAQDGR